MKYQLEVEHWFILDDNRKCTDILCIIIGLGLTIILAIFAILTFNRRILLFIQLNIRNKFSLLIATVLHVGMNTQDSIMFISPSRLKW